MSLDNLELLKLQLLSENSSNKIIKQGTGSFNIAAVAGVGQTFSSAVIPHGYPNDNLLFQVTAYSNTPGAILDQTTLPWASGDGRVYLFARLGLGNLEVFGIHNSSSALGIPARTINFAYRILVP